MKLGRSTRPVGAGRVIHGLSSTRLHKGQCGLSGCDFHALVLPQAPHAREMQGAAAANQACSTAAGRLARRTSPARDQKQKPGLRFGLCVDSGRCLE